MTRGRSRAASAGEPARASSAEMKGTGALVSETLGAPSVAASIQASPDPSQHRARGVSSAAPGPSAARPAAKRLTYAPTSPPPLQKRERLAEESSGNGSQKKSSVSAKLAVTSGWQKRTVPDDDSGLWPFAGETYYMDPATNLHTLMDPALVPSSLLARWCLTPQAKSKAISSKQPPQRRGTPSPEPSEARPSFLEYEWLKLASQIWHAGSPMPPPLKPMSEEEESCDPLYCRERLDLARGEEQARRARGGRAGSPSGRGEGRLKPEGPPATEAQVVGSPEKPIRVEFASSSAERTGFAKETAGPSPAGCACTKSQCLKKYCCCFAAHRFCSTQCTCQGCANRASHERSGADSVVWPSAATKDRAAAAPAGSTAGVGTSAAAPRCTCSKSFCVKKYCPCYAAAVHCDPTSCQCRNCQNLAPAREG